MRYQLWSATDEHVDISGLRIGSISNDNTTAKHLEFETDEIFQAKDKLNHCPNILLNIGEFWTATEFYIFDTKHETIIEYGAWDLNDISRLYSCGIAYDNGQKKYCLLEKPQDNSETGGLRSYGFCIDTDYRDGEVTIFSLDIVRRTHSGGNVEFYSITNGHEIESVRLFNPNYFRYK